MKKFRNWLIKLPLQKIGVFSLFMVIALGVGMFAGAITSNKSVDSLGSTAAATTSEVENIAEPDVKRVATTDTSGETAASIVANSTVLSSTSSICGEQKAYSEAFEASLYKGIDGAREHVEEYLDTTKAKNDYIKSTNDFIDSDYRYYLMQMNSYGCSAQFEKPAYLALYNEPAVSVVPVICDLTAQGQLTTAYNTAVAKETTRWQYESDVIIQRHFEDGQTMLELLDIADTKHFEILDKLSLDYQADLRSINC